MSQEAIISSPLNTTAKSILKCVRHYRLIRWSLSVGVLALVAVAIVTSAMNARHAARRSTIRGRLKFISGVAFQYRNRHGESVFDVAARTKTSWREPGPEI